jgi:AraC-like DNA-binding protein
MLADLLAETAQADPADPLVERIIALILALISREPGLQGERAPGSGQQLARFLPAIARLRQAPGARLPLAEAARLCHLSPAYFSRRFADVFRCGFSDYVTSYKLHVAAREIATTSKPLGEIGFELGFASPSHFAARFHERFGLSPRAYRLRVQGQR